MVCPGFTLNNKNKQVWSAGLEGKHHWSRVGDFLTLESLFTFVYIYKIFQKQFEMAPFTKFKITANIFYNQIKL